jgi:uncharacterized repeat protein (TIGR03803 family)
VPHVYKRPGWPWGGLTFDKAGNLYGTTEGNGPNNKNCGTVFEITP